MNCFSCRHQFNEKESIPRLLIQCGHTICEQCTKRLFKTNCIRCPECNATTAVPSVASLPKNMALISIKSPAQSTPTGSVCPKHSKNFEFFCQKIKSLLCAGCLLESGSKNYDLVGIEPAAANERAFITDSLLNGKQIEEKVKSTQKDLEFFKEELSKSALKVIQEINTLFNEIRHEIDRRESACVSKVKEQLETQKEIIFKHEEKLLQQLEHLRIFFAMVEKDQSSNDFSLLTRAAKRRDRVKEATAPAPKIAFSMPFSEVQRDQELRTLWGILNKKPVAQPQIDKKKQPSHNPQSHPTRTHPKLPAHSASNLDPTEKLRNQREAIQKHEPASSSNGDRNKKPTGPVKGQPFHAKKRAEQKEKIAMNELYARFEDAKEMSSSLKGEPTTGFASDAEHYASGLISSCSLTSGIEFLDSNLTSIVTTETKVGVHGEKRPENGRKKGEIDFSSALKKVGSYIYVFGGFVEHSSLSIERFDTLKETWETVSKLPGQRAKFGLVQIPSGNIVIMGGKQEGVRVNYCDEFDPFMGKWIKTDMKLTKNMSGFGSISLNDQIYICGGNDGKSILSTFEVYSTKTKKWKELPPMHFPRDELSFILGIDGYFYAIGGFGGGSNSCLSHVERFSLEKNKWEDLPELNTARRALTAVSMPDGIYVLGGFNGEKYLSSVEKLDMGAQIGSKWAFVEPMKRARCTAAAAPSPDHQFIYVFGGFDNQPLKQIEK